MSRTSPRIVASQAPLCESLKKRPTAEQFKQAVLASGHSEHVAADLGSSSFAGGICLGLRGCESVVSGLAHHLSSQSHEKATAACFSCAWATYLFNVHKGSVSSCESSSRQHVRSYLEDFYNSLRASGDRDTSWLSGEGPGSGEHRVSFYESLVNRLIAEGTFPRSAFTLQTVSESLTKCAQGCDLELGGGPVIESLLCCGIDADAGAESLVLREALYARFGEGTSSVVCPNCNDTSGPLIGLRQQECTRRTLIRQPPEVLCIEVGRGHDGAESRHPATKVIVSSGFNLAPEMEWAPATLAAVHSYLTSVGRPSVSATPVVLYHAKMIMHRWAEKCLDAYYDFFVRGPARPPAEADRHEQPSWFLYNDTATAGHRVVRASCPVSHRWNEALAPPGAEPFLRNISFVVYEAEDPELIRVFVGALASGPGGAYPSRTPDASSVGTAFAAPATSVSSPAFAAPPTSVSSRASVASGLGVPEVSVTSNSYQEGQRGMATRASGLEGPVGVCETARRQAEVDERFQAAMAARAAWRHAQMQAFSGTKRLREGSQASGVTSRCRLGEL
jgi:hypothetical protein